MKRMALLGDSRQAGSAGRPGGKQTLLTIRSTTNSLPSPPPLHSGYRDPLKATRGGGWATIPDTPLCPPPPPPALPPLHLIHRLVAEVVIHDRCELLISSFSKQFACCCFFARLFNITLVYLKRLRLFLLFADLYHI